MALEKNDFVQIEKIVEKSTESLAVMINGGFNATQKIINENQKENIRRLNLLETGQEDIKLRLDNAAWRFEVVALQNRVKRLEKKVGIS